MKRYNRILVLFVILYSIFLLVIPFAFQRKEDGQEFFYKMEVNMVLQHMEQILQQSTQQNQQQSTQQNIQQNQQQGTQQNIPQSTQQTEQQSTQQGLQQLQEWLDSLEFGKLVISGRELSRIEEIYLLPLSQSNQPQDIKDFFGEKNKKHTVII